MGSNPGYPTVKEILEHGQIHVFLNSWDDPFAFDKGEWSIIPGVGIVYWVDGQNKKHARVLPFHKVEAFDILYE